MVNKVENDILFEMQLSERLQFFVDVGFFFSMQIRGKYNLNANHEDVEFRAINECFHRVFQCLRGIIKSNDMRTPDEIVLQMLCDISKEANLQEELSWAFGEAEKLLH